MRSLFLLTLLLVLTANMSTAQDTASEVSEPTKVTSLPRETVKFDGNTLGLAWENATDVERVKEYIPADQKLDRWTVLASIREFPALNDTSAVVRALVQELKKKYPQSPMALIENPDTGDVILDFVVWPADASFVEFNVFRYHKLPTGGVEARQYALRDYENQEAFLKGLRPVRERLVNLMATEGLKVSTAQDNESRSEALDRDE